MNQTIVMPVGQVLPKPVQVTPETPSPHAVRKQLSIILCSEGFVHAKRMRRFLEFIVEETLAGRSSQLREYGIGVSVFGRDESFEPGIDPIVRNDARRLRQKLLEYYQRPRSRERDQVLIEMPKGSYVPVFRSTCHSQAAKAGPQYRLAISLVRIADGAEIWAEQHEY